MFIAIIVFLGGFMPISGIVVSCEPERLETLGRIVSELDGIEVHGTLPDGKIIAVIEAETVQDEVDLVAKLHDLEGVVAVRMAYHNFEDVAL